MSESTKAVEQKAAPTPTGVFAKIARRHEEIRSDKHLELWVPGYEGMIKVRYRLLHDSEMDELVERSNRTKHDEGVAGDRKALANDLVRMCDRIVVRDGEQDLVLEDEKGPVRFERRFAALIGQQAGIRVDGELATEILENFFCPLTDPDDPSSPRAFPNAISRHNMAIVAWYQGERDSIDAELLGN